MQYCVRTAAWLDGAAAAARVGCWAAGWLAATASITAQVANTAKKALFMAKPAANYISVRALRREHAHRRHGDAFVVRGLRQEPFGRDSLVRPTGWRAVDLLQPEGPAAGREGIELRRLVVLGRVRLPRPRRVGRTAQRPVAPR